MNYFPINTLYLEVTHACNQHCRYGYLQTYDQIEASIAVYKDEPLYSLSYGFLAVHPNGDMSFSCNWGNPYTFGKAYESIKIPGDEYIKSVNSIL